MGGRETNDAISAAYEAYRCMKLPSLMLYAIFQATNRNIGYG